MATRIQVRRGSTSDWSTANPILAAGEIGFDTTTANIKVGDGSTAWNALPYQLPYATGARASSLSATLSVDNDNDRVGIGTTTPSEKLDVVGNTELNGTLSVSGNTTLSGDLAVDGGDITTSAGTLNIAGTITGAQTVNIATGVTTTGNTKTVNIATGGYTGSTTNVNIGSASGGTLAVLKNATIAGTLSVAETLSVTGVISGPGTIPIGGIIMWSGATIPTGWALCDGASGRPDLRNKFVFGGHTYGTTGTMPAPAWYETLTGGSNPVGGGNKDAIVPAHTHTVTETAHRHNFVYDDNVSDANLAPYDVIKVGNNLGGGAEGSGTTLLYQTSAATTGVSVNSAGVSATNGRMPPYVVIAFIIRIA